MNIRLCDKCKKKLEDYKGNGFKIVKKFEIYFLGRNIITNEKEAFDKEEYCEECYEKILEKLDEIK